MPSFAKLHGKKGGIISAVDVILGLGLLGEMESLRPEGATGFLDTNYENKARAAVDLLRRNDFVYVHVEAVDECGHLGDLANKIKGMKTATSGSSRSSSTSIARSTPISCGSWCCPTSGAGQAAQAHP